MADSDDLAALAEIVRLRERLRGRPDDPKICARVAGLFAILNDGQATADWLIRASRAAGALRRPNQDYTWTEVHPPFRWALDAVDAAPDYLPGRNRLAEVCAERGVTLEWALDFVATRREARGLEGQLASDDAVGSRHMELACFWLEKGRPEESVNCYLRAAKHAEAHGELKAALAALDSASQIRSYKVVLRELTRVAALLKKGRTG